MEKFSLFVSCSSGLEPLLMDELEELGFTNLHPGHRGVYVDFADWSAIYRINYGSRLAHRVLLPLSKFKCYDQKSLYASASAINWLPYFKKSSNTLAIDANVHHRQLRNSLFAAQLVKDAICDQIREKTGRRPTVELTQPDVQINLFINNDWGVISFDTSGLALNKRGYRIESVEAPMQETLAAAILRLAKYNEEQIVLDPCCGSGTLLIEAALMASHTPPGFLRTKWGFMAHPDHDQNLWLTTRNQLDAQRKPLLTKHLFGMDINKNSVRVTKTNLKAAGFGNDIEVIQADFRETTPSVLPNMIITNPPHGRRLEETDSLRPLYRALGQFMKENTIKPGRGFILSGNAELGKEVGLASTKKHVLTSGGVDSRLLEYDLF